MTKGEQGTDFAESPSPVAINAEQPGRVWSSVPPDAPSQTISTRTPVEPKYTEWVSIPSQVTSVAPAVQ